MRCVPGVGTGLREGWNPLLVALSRIHWIQPIEDPLVGPKPIGCAVPYVSPADSSIIEGNPSVQLELKTYESVGGDFRRERDQLVSLFGVTSYT